MTNDNKNNGNGFTPKLPAFENARVAWRYVAGMLQAAAEIGVEPEFTRAVFGFSADPTPAPESVPVAAYLTFLERAASQTGDPLIGLRLGLRSRVADQAAFPLLLMAASDVRGLVEQVCRFESLTHDLWRTQVLVENGIGKLRIVSPWFDRPGGRQLVYSAAAGARAQSRWLVGIDLPALEFACAYGDCDSPPGEFERVLGAPTRFGARHNEICFPAALLDLPLPTADAAAFPILQQIAQLNCDTSPRFDAPRQSPNCASICVANCRAERPVWRNAPRRCGSPSAPCNANLPRKRFHSAICWPRRVASSPRNIWKILRLLQRKWLICLASISRVRSIALSVTGSECRRPNSVLIDNRWTNFLASLTVPWPPAVEKRVDRRRRAIPPLGVIFRCDAKSSLLGGEPP